MFQRERTPCHLIWRADNSEIFVKITPENYNKDPAEERNHEETMCILQK